MTDGAPAPGGFDLLMMVLALAAGILVVFLALATRRLRALERERPEAATPPRADPDLVRLLRAALRDREADPGPPADAPAERPEP